MEPSDEPLEERTITLRRSPLAGSDPLAAELVDFLLLTPDGAPPQRISLSQHPVLIGRTAPATIVLEGGTVSRRHCEITRQSGGQIVIADLGSTNGTYVNGARIDALVTLSDGDTIAIGAHTLRYHRRTTNELATTESIERELEAAVGYVRAVLPEPITTGPVLADWMYGHSPHSCSTSRATAPPRRCTPSRWPMSCAGACCLASIHATPRQCCAA